MKQKSTRRIGYDAARRLAAEQRKLDRRRGKLNGYPEPNNKRKKKNNARLKTPSKSVRYGSRESGEVDRQSIAEEIEGAGSLGSPGIGEIREGGRLSDSDIFAGSRSGLSRVTDYGSKVAAHEARK